ncbi:glutathione peroxidase [Aeromonas hydrophila]|uniref:glutathione peroxidase n=1 Tax=Aeromonas hydrophila TaxID=644 RepID=UPI000D0DD529|nr:glutathione peroxidase [Aeromonas hydrophila]AVP86077.1 glutathione peroxidase [Aeromonas hydrophila]ELA9380172.1 glutathione peroxidase [Aeromonas hydrophila]MDL5382757.1 glutathione peroxidase [Aeromonas hydrophila]
MKWIMLLLTLGAGAAVAACPDYFNVEMRELNSTQRHNLCQLTEGKVVLVVNTASYCGYRGQFRDLETLYQTYKEKGLVVLGFPSNDFWQEAGDEVKTASVCRRDYGVTFPMFNRIAVRGADASPLYRGLAAAAGEAPGWNFHKYLIGRDGKLVASYGANQNPADDPLQKEVKRALGL